MSQSPAPYVNPLPELLQWVLKGQIRHILTYMAGLLTAMGALPNQAAHDQFMELGSSAILFVAGCAWSAMEKKADKASVNAAIVTTAAASSEEIPH